MFGLDINNTDNSSTFGGSTNQYQTSPNQQQPQNTGWMAPSNTDSTLKAPSSPSGSGFNWLSPQGQDNTGQNQQAPAQTDVVRNQIPAGDGTVISATQNGWQFGGIGYDPNNPQSPWNGGNTGINGGNIWMNPINQPPQQSQNQSTGQYMPQGYDQGKFNDPNKHDPKYDIGRILSNYPPGPAGLDQAMNQLSQQGFTRTGKDTIYRADVGTVDVGKSFGSGDPSQMAWQWSPADDGSGNSFGANPNGNYINNPYQQQPQAPQYSQKWQQIQRNNQGFRPNMGLQYRPNLGDMKPNFGNMPINGMPIPYGPSNPYMNNGSIGQPYLINPNGADDGPVKGWNQSLAFGINPSLMIPFLSGNDNIIPMAPYGMPQ